MFKIINVIYLIRYVAIGTTLLTIFISELMRVYFPNYLVYVRPYTLSSVFAVALTFALTSKGISRRIWRGIRSFNRSLYPDLNGVWHGEIVIGDGSVVLEARAIIRQYLLSTEIDMHTETVKSLTLEATPSANMGQFQLYYTYCAKPKNPKHGSYTGSTIFDIRLLQIDGKDVFELSGHYYTARGTIGRVRLQQIESSKETDVSFY